MRVLVADDDRFSRVYLTALLEGWGYQVTTASDGQEACRLLEAQEAPPMAILDWYMPVLDGVEVVRRVRSGNQQTIPTYIVMLTGMDGEKGLVEALDAGADDYIRKPFRQTELQARLKVGARLVGLQEVLNSRVLELENALTARQTVEVALRANEERFRLFFDTLPEPVWGFDARTLQILEANRAAAHHYGYSRDEFLGMKLSQLWASDAPSAIPQGGTVDGQARHRTKEGKLIDVEVFWREIDVGDNHTALASVHDITENKRLELELRHSQKLEAVGTLAAGIAHEINTPIQFVGDNTRFLNDAFQALTKVLNKYQEACRQLAKNGPAEVLEELQQAEAAADIGYLIEEAPLALSQTIEGVEQVTRIVRAMKEFAHPDSGNRMASDLNKAIESVLVVARNEFKLVADVETCYGDIPAVVCEIGELNQVFLNLLVNAAHAISDARANGGRARGYIKIKTYSDGPEVVVSIQDTGGGIPESIRDRIYDPFFTTKEVGRGTGQGLAISRNIVVDKHGGSLSFETETGRGTTFYVRLPLEHAVDEHVAAETL